MNIQQNIKFDRVHRLGRYKRYQTRPRPIIAKFHDFSSKDMVKRKAPETLKNTPYGVREQYPEEYERRRKVLYPKMKHAKQNKDNKVRLVKDTLYINNEKYICGRNDQPVRVEYQTANGRSQNYNQRDVSDRQTDERPRMKFYPQTTDQQQQQQQNNNQNLQQQERSEREKQPFPEPTIRTVNHREKNNAMLPQNTRQSSRLTESVFESQNIYTSLPDSDSDRQCAGKTKASSPLQGEILNKKQKEYSSDDSFMELTPSPVVAKSPVTLNSNTVSQERKKSDQQKIKTINHMYLPKIYLWKFRMLRLLGQKIPCIVTSQQYTAIRGVRRDGLVAETYCNSKSELNISFVNVCGLKTKLIFPEFTDF